MTTSHGQSWVPRHPRYQRRHVPPRHVAPVYEVRVIGTESPARKRLACGFEDAHGHTTCPARDLGALALSGHVMLATGAQFDGTMWWFPRTRDRGRFGLAGRSRAVPATALPILARCEDGHVSRIAATVLDSIREFLGTMMPT